jgi:hypothetical protein
MDTYVVIPLRSLAAGLICMCAVIYHFYSCCGQPNPNNQISHGGWNIETTSFALAQLM